MTHPDPNLSISVDVTNPGQFFACCGLLELAYRLWPNGGVEGWFTDGRLLLSRTDGEPASIRTLVDAAAGCDVRSVTANDPKTAPIRLSDPVGIRLDWWLRPDGTTNLFKTWAANATSRQMFSKWQEPLRRSLASVNAGFERMLSVSDRLQGSYGFDSDLGWDSLTVGFSLNEHATLKQLPTRPAVELFGAIGLQRFFPNFDERAQVVRYSTWRVPLSVPVARAAAIGLVPSVTLQRLRTCFVYRGSFKGLDTATIVQGDADE